MRLAPRLPGALIGLLASLLSAGCAAHVVTRPLVPPPYLDTLPIPEPAERSVHTFGPVAQATVFRPLRTLLDPPALIHRAVGDRERAQDIGTFDDVAPSSWFQQRNAVRPMTPEEVRIGPDTGGPDTDSLVITGTKPIGVTPGFRVRDARGDTYFLKFDLSRFPETTTAAEVISTQLFYAAGYNTPENYLVTFPRGHLQIAPGVTIRDASGHPVPLTPEAVDRLLADVAWTKSGEIRAVASKAIPGRPKGPFGWSGRRPDDPNDLIPHEDRRVLRGLRPMAAWTGHVDLKPGNTYDAFIEVADGRGYIRHYLFDFGSTLGSGAVRPHQPRDGSEYSFDFPLVFGRLFALGTVTADWADSRWTPTNPPFGYFPADFDPGAWRPTLPLRAFQEMTDADGYWGATLVRSFTDAQIRAAVSAGRLSDTAAAARLTRTLIARRDRIAAYWFVRVTPIEKPRVQTEPDGRQRMELLDLARRSGVMPDDGAVYEWRFRHDALDLSAGGRVPGVAASSVVVPIPGLAAERARRAQRRGLRSGRQLTAVLSVRARWRERSAGREANLYLRLDPETGLYHLVGLEH